MNNECDHELLQRVGRLVHFHRKRMKISAKQLAYEISSTVATIKDLEWFMAADLDVYTLVRLSEVFRVDFEELLEPNSYELISSNSNDKTITWSFYRKQAMLMRERSASMRARGEEMKRQIALILDRANALNDRLSD